MKSTSLRPVRRGHRKCVRCGEVKPDAEIGPTYGPYMGKCLDDCEPPETGLEQSPIRPVNAERKAKRYDRDFGAKADFIRDQPCDTCGAPPPNDPSHFPSRGAGGTKEDTFPQCRICHRTMGQKGVDTFLRTLEPPRDRMWLSGRTEHWEARWREENDG